MAALPEHRPKHLSLGSLEREILDIVWQHGVVTVKDVHQCILRDPNRELAYASVTTVLHRLTQKGWLGISRQGRILYWEALVSEQDARILEAHAQLQRFLDVGDADVVAAFADDLDRASIDKLEAIAHRLKSIRAEREKE